MFLVKILGKKMFLGIKKRKIEDCCFISCVGGSLRYIIRFFFRERRVSGIESIG